MTVNILGTAYKILFVSPDHFEDGYCCCTDGDTHRILIDAEYEMGDAEYCRLLRGEVVNAYLYESGLFVESFKHPGAWTQNDEMVGWFAIQGPKIMQTWLNMGLIEQPEVQA